VAYSTSLENIDDRMLFAAGRTLHFVVVTLLGILVASFLALAYRHLFAAEPGAINPAP
jgi:hypothetical protein